MSRLRFSLAAVLLVCLLCTATLFAQTPTAVVNGTVTDPTGASVPDAKVTVVNQDTNVTASRNTSADGTFNIINLLPGKYTLTVEKTGFKKVALPVFQLDVNQTLTQKLAMEIGALTDTVTISAESVGVMVQRSSTELGTTFDETMAHELPMNGRNFTQLLILQPGINPVDTSQGNSSGKTSGGGNPDGGNISLPGATVYKVSANGAGNRSNAYYMDGIINTDDRGGGWAVPPIADSIQEFKVQSHNNDAQYGNVLGSVINIVTKSGSNAFHGSAWEFARSQIFDARNPFSDFCTPGTCPALANTLNSQVAAGTQTAAGASTILSGTPFSPVGYSQNEFGGTFGGRIIKNKTFFFVAYEGWRYTKPNATYIIVPSAAELTGDFSNSLIGSVNAAKTSLTPNNIFNPFAESGASSSVRFSCDASGNPLPLLNPSLAFGQAGYGSQGSGGTACNKIPAGLIDSKLVNIISAYTASAYKNCQFQPNYAFAIDNCLDTRSTVNNNNNYDFRVDHHFSDKNTVFARAYMMWDNNNGIVAGTNSITPSPFHTWNIGGAWDHIFTPNLILEARGGINARPVLVNATNPQGSTPESAAGFNNLAPTSGFFLNVGGYIGSANNGIGNVGPQNRANPEHSFNTAMTWTHGRHTVQFGGEWLYENRTEINDYENFTSTTAPSCPTNSSGLFNCGSGQGNGLAAMLMDLPSTLTVNVPQYSGLHISMQSVGFFLQDEWHPLSNVTIDVGVRYDYVMPVKILTNNGETVNAIDIPGQRYYIGSANTAAYSTGCGTPVAPPCVPGGLNPGNTNFTNVSAGGVTYNTLNNIAFTNGQAGLKAIKDNFGPRIGIAWGFAHNTVLRLGYGLFYDPIAYRSQYAENTLQGSIWPWTRGVADTLNNAPMGATATSTIFPICTTLATCGSFGGYATSQLPGLVGSNPMVISPTPWTSAFGGYSNAPNYSDPRSQQWNVQIERQLSANAMVSIGYVGSHTQRLEWCCAANYPQGGPFCEPNSAQGFSCPGTTLTQAQIATQESMPYAAQGWKYSQSTAFATYNSLQAQFQQRFAHGIETVLAFTMEKCLGDSNGGFNAENGSEGAPYEYFFNAHLSKGLCTYDIPKVFTFTAVYQLPFGKGRHWLNHGVLSQIVGGWNTNYALLARTGQAFNPSWGGASSICTLTATTNCVPATVGGVSPTSNDPANLSNAAGAITGYSRPSVLPNCQVNVGVKTVTQWYNPACFVSPASLAVGPGYGFGDTPLGFLRSMKWINLDVVLSKEIRITETKRLQFRAEGFNVLNHMVLAVPGTGISPSFSGGSISYGTAGTITNIANTPRALQLAMKFMF